MCVIMCYTIGMARMNRGFFIDSFEATRRDSLASFKTGRLLFLAQTPARNGERTRGDYENCNNKTMQRGLR